MKQTNDGLHIMEIRNGVSLKTIEAAKLAKKERINKWIEIGMKITEYATVIFAFVAIVLFWMYFKG